MNIRDYGKFGVKPYFAPSKKARGFWHGDNKADSIKWCHFPRSGGSWEISKSVSGFDTEQQAVDAARALLRELGEDE